MIVKKTAIGNSNFGRGTGVVDKYPVRKGTTTVVKPKKGTFSSKKK